MKKSVLITGTSSGVGLESAIRFAENGFKVYASMRNLEKSGPIKERMNADDLAIELLELDVTNVDSIKKAVDHVIGKEGKIDILINNAGAGFAKTTEFSTVEEIRWVTEVNYLGTVFCTQAVLPHMRKEKSGHIINISSVGGLIGQPFNELYCGAKFAVEGFSEGLASYLGPAFNINISIVEPGGIATQFMTSAIDKTTVDGALAPEEYRQVFERYMEGNQRRANEGKTQVYQTGAEVAEVVLNVAKNENPPLRIRTSAWAEKFTELKTKADPDGLLSVKRVQADFL